MQARYTYHAQTHIRTVWLLSAELYPTSVRSTGFGLLGAAGRAASLLCTYASGVLLEIALWAPLAMSAALLAGVPADLPLMPHALSAYRTNGLDGRTCVLSIRHQWARREGVHCQHMACIFSIWHQLARQVGIHCQHYGICGLGRWSCSVQVLG